MFFLMEVVGKNYIDGYKLITIRGGDNFLNNASKEIGKFVNTEDII